MCDGGERRTQHDFQGQGLNVSLEGGATSWDKGGLKRGKARLFYM